MYIYIYIYLIAKANVKLYNLKRNFFYVYL